MALRGRVAGSIFPRVFRKIPSLFTKKPAILKRSDVQTFVTSAKLNSNTVTVKFINLDGSKSSVAAKVGNSIQETATDNDISDLLCSCGGTLTCSTCHVIFDAEEMSRLNLDEPCYEENELLDLVYSGRTETSRLGCQVTVTKEFDGITLTIPESQDLRDN